MIVPDVNVLLAAFRADHVHHSRARDFLTEVRQGDEPLGLSVLTLAAVVRLATNSRVFVNPDTTDAVLDYIDVLLDEPALIVREADGHWARFAELCRLLQLRGNHVPDAHLAAIALDHRAELVTFDRGFAKFPRLRWRCLLDS